VSTAVSGDWLREQAALLESFAVVTAESVAALRTARDSGARIAYAADPTLATFQVTAD
jgi:hypothetical protein